MKTDKLNAQQKKLLESILNSKYTAFGELKEFEITLEVFAGGHPICSPPVGWCAPGNYIGGSGTTCPNGVTTYTWCAS